MATIMRRGETSGLATTVQEKMAQLGSSQLVQAAVAVLLLAFIMDALVTRKSSLRKLLERKTLAARKKGDLEKDDDDEEDDLEGDREAPAGLSRSGSSHDSLSTLSSASSSSSFSSLSSLPRVRKALSPRSYLGKLRSLIGEDEVSHRRVGLAVATSAAGLAAAKSAAQRFAALVYRDEKTPAGNRVSFFESPSSRSIAEALRTLEAYSTPTFYNNHLMTGAPILRIDEELSFTRDVLSARLDGHLVEVAADTLASPRASASSPSFIIVPGFGGSSDKNLYRILAKSIAERFDGYVHILHERGEGGMPLRSYKLHKMDTRMLETLVAKVRADRGADVPLFGLGLSQGGSLLLKFVQGFSSADCPFLAVMTVGSTFQYQVGLQLMEVNGLVGRCYSYILAKMHIEILRRNKHVLDALDAVDMDDIATCSNLSDLDRKLATPVYGHHSVVDYHDSFNLVEHAHKIDIPVLCLHSEDDPLFSDDTHRIQRAAAQCSDRIVFFSVPQGGHLSFCERGTRSTYVTRVADRFFKTLLRRSPTADAQTRA